MKTKYILAEIEVDDVVQGRPTNQENESSYEPLDDQDENDFDVDSEIAFHPESEESDQEDEPHISMSRDGTEWHTDAEAAGRRPRRNIVTQQTGFQRGLRPNTRLEAFLVIFEHIIACVVMYTNITGRRLGRVKNFTWQDTTRDEIHAFIGLHLLAGRHSAFASFSDFLNLSRDP